MRGDAGDTIGAAIVSGETGKYPSGLRGANDNGAPVEERTITLRRTLPKSGVTIKVKVAVADFIGVAVSTTINDDGMLFSAVDLVHSDPDLNYRVFEEEGNNTVVAEWQNWGRQLGLPLYIRAGNGNLIAYSQQVGGVLIGDTSMRRKLGPEAGRRPRFLNRRQLGIVVSN